MDIPAQKCTMRQEEDLATKNMEVCSSLDDCYDHDKQIYLNERCRRRESCARMKTHDDSTGTETVWQGCILSSYCADNTINRARTLFDQGLRGLDCMSGAKRRTSSHFSSKVAVDEFDRKQGAISNVSAEQLRQIEIHNRQVQNEKIDKMQLRDFIVIEAAVNNLEFAKRNAQCKHRGRNLGIFTVK
jgi:hypothetical protein